MNNKICLSKTHFLIIFLSLILTLIFSNMKNNKELSYNCDNTEIKKELQFLKNNINNNNNNYNINKIINENIDLRNKLINDNIISRDRKVINDPIYPPLKRLPNHLINSIPTRGYPDNYHMVGILNRKDDEKILQLFGRQRYPGSHQWEYYVTGNDPNGFTVKIPFKMNNYELIDDTTTINIPQLNGEFKATIYENSGPVYNPNLY